MTPTEIEYRPRGKDAPDGIRIFLGRAETKAEARSLRAQRDLLARLGKRGDWPVVQAVADGRVSMEALERAVELHGVRDFDAHLDLYPTPDAPTLQAHVERWWETIEKAGTRKVYVSGLGHLLGFTPSAGGTLGARPWHEIYAHHVEEARNHLRKDLARATLATYLAAWSAFFDWALKREGSQAKAEKRPPLRVENPVRKAEVWMTVHPTRHRFLEPHEYRALLAVAAPPMRAQYATLVMTGIRGGEFRNLPPGHVSLEKVSVAPWGEWVPKGYPKVKRGIRDVPVHQAHLRPLLEEYEREWAGEDYFFVNPRTGGRWTATSFRRQFYMDVEAAGMAAGTRGPDGEPNPRGVSPHTTRHTFASWLAIRDVQLMKIAHLMGDTVDTVERYYAHLLPSDLDATVQGLDVEAP